MLIGGKGRRCKQENMRTPRKEETHGCRTQGTCRSLRGKIVERRPLTTGTPVKRSDSRRFSHDVAKPGSDCTEPPRHEGNNGGRRRDQAGRVEMRRTAAHRQRPHALREQAIDVVVKTPFVVRTTMTMTLKEVHPTIVRGLAFTGVSEGVMTPRKKSLLELM